jgi:5'-phosphate synthase pdxT subunit
VAPKVGILSLQGCIDPHANHLRALGAEVVFVRNPSDLDGIEGLILPGGESTTMIHVAKTFGLWEPLRAASERMPFWGICAGSILMARKVENPEQESLGVMDIHVRRNAYGRQLESFQATVSLSAGGNEPAVFIRAPKFVSWGSGVKVAGKIGDEISFLDDGMHLVTAFHPELTDSGWFHKLFLSRISQTR